MNTLPRITIQLPSPTLPRAVKVVRNDASTARSNAVRYQCVFYAHPEPLSLTLQEQPVLIAPSHSHYCDSLFGKAQIHSNIVKGCVPEVVLLSISFFLYRIQRFSPRSRYQHGDILTLIPFCFLLRCLQYANESEDTGILQITMVALLGHCHCLWLCLGRASNDRTQTTKIDPTNKMLFCLPANPLPLPQRIRIYSCLGGNSRSSSSGISGKWCLCRINSLFPGLGRGRSMPGWLAMDVE